MTTGLQYSVIYRDNIVLFLAMIAQIVYLSPAKLVFAVREPVAVLFSTFLDKK